MEPTVSVTERLRQEHRTILVVVDALERILRGADPGDPPVDELRDCLTFFRSFADACHHGKEEDVLFEELEQQGMPREEGPIAVMRYEHRLGRRLVAAMGEALEALAADDPGAWGRLQQSGWDYVELMRGHIVKEDGALFQMADGMVGGPACARICARYDEVCSRRFEGRRKEELEELAQSIAHRTGQPASNRSGPKGERS